MVCHIKLSLLTSEQGRKLKFSSHIIRIVFMLVVLVLAGIELIFFLVAGTVCFGFSVRITLITH